MGSPGSAASSISRNADAYVPRKELRAGVASIFAPSSICLTGRLLKHSFESDCQVRETAPKLANWLEKSIPEDLTVFDFPKAPQRKIRTTNGLKRVNREVHRRTQVVSIFPNEAACLRLASAVLMEIDED